jgi:isoleucyl-tRNA synthetase
VNDLVLDAEGQKMSKSRGNAVDPWAVIERHGVDAVRLFLVASSQVWIPRRFDETVIRETAGRFLLTLKHTYSGIFAQYANLGWSPSEEDPVVADRPLIDRWVLSRLATVERAADGYLQRYEATLAARAVMEFFDEDVSKWYVRLNRHRFYDVDSPDNRAAFATLHEVLTVTCRLLAPFAPFLTDWMHRELVGESVHLASYVREGAPPADPLLEGAMADVRLLATLGRAAREQAGIKVRQPLSRLVCVVPHGREGAVAPLTALLAAELNVKDVTFASSADTLVTLTAKPNFRSLGKKFGKDTPLAAAAVAAFTSEHLRAFERGEPLSVTVNGQTNVLDAGDVTIVREASGDLVVVGEGGYFAALDSTVTTALRQEGIAREVVSRVQRTRKELRLAVSERIRLWVAGNEEVEAAVREYRTWIAEQVLARELTVGELPGESNAMQAAELDGASVCIALTRE